MTTDETEERSNLMVLGRMIGTNDGWDEGDGMSFLIYDFKPVDALANVLPSGDIIVNYDDGNFELWHDAQAGSPTHVIDMAVIMHIPRDDAETVTFTQPKEWGTITGSAPIAEPWPETPEPTATVQDVADPVKFDFSKLPRPTPRADVDKAIKIATGEWPTKADIDTVLAGGSIPVTFDDDERDDVAEDMQALQDRDRE